MGKTSDLSDFERGMIVGTRLAGPTSTSEMAAFLGFSDMTTSRVYWETERQTQNIQSDAVL